MITMRFDYFYEEQSESYSFYRIPKCGDYHPHFFYGQARRGQKLYNTGADAFSLLQFHKKYELALYFSGKSMVKYSLE